MPVVETWRSVGRSPVSLRFAKRGDGGVMEARRIPNPNAEVQVLSVPSHARPQWYNLRRIMKHRKDRDAQHHFSMSIAVRHVTTHRRILARSYSGLSLSVPICGDESCHCFNSGAPGYSAFKQCFFSLRKHCFTTEYSHEAVARHRKIQS
ncbi:MAG: hypothetical protein JWM11_1178 [Planctomycetaceae bacterium]|nr:hypothetical protein [Planctomycetaceae bacterium]